MATRFFEVVQGRGRRWLPSRTLMSSAVALMVGSSLAQGLMAISSLLMARFLGPAEFGAYSTNLLTAGLAAVLVNWGLDNWLHWRGGQHPENLSRLLRTALLIKGGSFLPWWLLLVLILPRINPVTFPPTVVLVSAVVVWVEGLLGLLLAALKATLRNRAAAWLLLGLRGSWFLLVMLGIGLGIRPIFFFLYTRLAISLVLLLIAWIVLQPWKTWGGSISLRFVFRESLPFAVSDLLAAIYTQADVTIAGSLLGKAAAGLYSPASSLVNALFVIPTALYGVAVPVLGRAFPGPIAGKRRALGWTLGGFIGMGLALMVGTWVTADLLTAFVLGEAFSQTAVLLRILSPILFFKALSFAAISLIVALGWQKQRLPVQLCSALINLVLNLILVGAWGILGVAWVYVFSEVILCVGYWGIVMKGIGPLLAVDDTQEERACPENEPLQF